MAADRAINLFPELIEPGTGKNKFGLFRTPGLRGRWTLPDGPVRPGRGSMFTIPFSYPTSERTFVVSGSTFYELFSDYTSVSYGSVGTDGLPVFMAYNGTTIAIASNQRLYLFDVATNTLTNEVLDINGDPLTPIAVEFLDGYFLINIPGSQNIQFSGIYDGYTWDPLDFFAAESNPDRATMILVDHDVFWVFGDQTIQPFTDTGDADSPFQAYKAGTLQQGLGAPACVSALDNGLFFLGKDSIRGGLVAWRADGTRLTRVSNHSVEQFWETYSRTDDAIGFAFVLQGHPFWQLTFPTANWSWRYDCSTGMWHEPLCFNSSTGNFEAHHAWAHTAAFGKHLVGDRGGTCCQDGANAPGSITITSECPITGGTVDSAYTFSFAISSGGTAPYVWEIVSGVLPAGLTLDSSSGTITGTPTEDGLFPFIIQVTDANGLVASKSCAVAIVPAVIPSECTDLDCLVNYSDDFLRANSDTLGSNWIEWTTAIGLAGGFGFTIESDLLQALGFEGAFPSGTIRTTAAAYATVPSTTVNQISKLIYKGTSGLPQHASLVNYDAVGGGPALRIQGSAGDYDAACTCYALRYYQSLNHVAPYALVTATLEIWYHSPTGVAQLATYSFPAGTGLNVDDEVKFTAMNFNPTEDTTSVCLHGYVNGVSKVDVTLPSTSLYYIGSGRFGISVGPSSGTDPNFEVSWDNWSGCEAVPAT